MGATAQRVVNRGGFAVIMDLERSNGAEEAGKHQNLRFVAGDITSPDDVQNAIDFTKSEFDNRIDLAVQCAGIGTAFTTVNAKMPPAKRTALFKKTIDINLTGAFNFVTHCAEHMHTQEPRALNPEDETIDHDSRGAIIMTASIVEVFEATQHPKFVRELADKFIGSVMSTDDPHGFIGLHFRFNPGDFFER